MTPEIWAVIIQTIILAAGAVLLAMRGERRITRLEGKVEHVEQVCSQVPGISRAVGRLEGKAGGK
jgi:hypothetical protein